MSPDTENTNQLIELCLQNNTSAQMQLYKRYYKAMYNTALRIVKDELEAEDVMQESFLSAFNKLHSFSREVSFGAWLKRIVINNSIQQYRKKSKYNVVPLEHVMYKVEENEAVNLSDESADVQARKVLQIMNTLKDNYRVSLTLHLIEGYDYEEIAQIMGISYANCRTTISRAKEHLRKKLQVLTS